MSSSETAVHPIGTVADMGDCGDVASAAAAPEAPRLLAPRDLVAGLRADLYNTADSNFAAVLDRLHGHDSLAIGAIRDALVEAIRRVHSFDHIQTSAASLTDLVPLSVMLAGPVPVGEMSERLRNLVVRNTSALWEDVVVLPSSEIASWANLGRLSHLELIAHCIVDTWLAVGSETPGVEGAGVHLAEPIDHGAAVRAQPNADRALAQAVATLLDWDTVHDGSIRAALVQLREMEGPLSTAAFLIEANAAPLRKTLGERAGALLRELDDRARQLFIERVLPSRPPTLSVIGDRLGVTRERVRQLEVKVKEEVDRLLRRPEYELLARAAAEVRRRSGRMLRAEVFDSILLDVACGDETAIELLRYRAGGYPASRHSDWVVADSEIDNDVAKLVGLNESGEFAAVALELAELGVHQSELLLEDLGYVSFEGILVNSRLSANGLAHATLSVRGSAMAADEMLALLPREVGERVFLNALSSDARLIRVRPDTWELAAWGGTPYVSIHHQLEAEIAKRGGNALRDELVQVLVDEFGVAPASVRAYLGQPCFTYDRATGEVSATDPSVFEDVTPPPATLAAGMSVVDGRVLFRVPVDHDLLRGSGRGVSVSLVRRLGLSWGTERSYRTTPGRPVTVQNKRAIPTMGSLRAINESLGGEAGDHLIVGFCKDGTATVDLVRSVDRNGEPPLVQVAQLVGVALGADEDSLSRICAALEADVATAADLHGVVRRRRDSVLSSVLAVYADERETSDD